MGFVAQLVEVSHLDRRESSIVDREMRVNNLPPSRRAETDKKCSVLTYISARFACARYRDRNLADPLFFIGLFTVNYVSHVRVQADPLFFYRPTIFRRKYGSTVRIVLEIFLPSRNMDL